MVLLAFSVISCHWINNEYGRVVCRVYHKLITITSLVTSHKMIEMHSTLFHPFAQQSKQ